MVSDEAPDMATLHAQGVSLEDAVARCQAWAAAHAEPELQRQAEPGPIVVEHVLKEPEPVLNLAMWMPPVAKAPKPFDTASDTDRLLCLSLLHTLTQMISGEVRVDPTPLVREGFSPSTAAELVDFMRRSKNQ